jgi:hypothetical protein
VLAWAGGNRSGREFRRHAEMVSLIACRGIHQCANAKAAKPNNDGLGGRPSTWTGFSGEPGLHVQGQIIHVMPHSSLSVASAELPGTPSACVYVWSDNLCNSTRLAATYSCAAAATSVGASAILGSKRSSALPIAAFRFAMYLSMSGVLQPHPLGSAGMASSAGFVVRQAVHVALVASVGAALLDDWDAGSDGAVMLLPVPRLRMIAAATIAPARRIAAVKIAIGNQLRGFLGPVCGAHGGGGGSGTSRALTCTIAASSTSLHRRRLPLAAELDRKT